VTNLRTDAMAPIPEEVCKGPDRIAIRLLKLHQRSESLDQLNNEEIGWLSRDLAQMKADYVRLDQTKSASSRKGRSTRGHSARTKASS
jgi:hypothetical protein